MSKKHDAIFDDILNDMTDDDVPEARTAARFLKRSNAVADQVGGQRQEKVLRLVDPATCVMWAGHNRAYDLLTAENCADLIEGLRAQGQQEFPAIVRKLDGQDAEYEVICGARRHFAVSWLRGNNYPQFRYLIEERDLTDEEAFRLADIENRDREDISDYERAQDYARAVATYYGGQQKVMADRLQISPAFLSRFLQLAKLDARIVAAFPSIRDVKEVHARQLRAVMVQPDAADRVFEEADRIKGQGLSSAEVMAKLKAAGKTPRKRRANNNVYTHPLGNVAVHKTGTTTALKFSSTLPDNVIRAAVESYLSDRTKA